MSDVEALVFSDSASEGSFTFSQCVPRLIDTHGFVYTFLGQPLLLLVGSVI